MANYEVELQPSNESGAKKTAWRGGRQFSAKVPQVLELTKEEVKVYEDDRRFNIKKTTAKAEPEPSETPSDSEANAQPTTPEAETPAEDNSSEDSSEDASEEADSSETEDNEEAPTVDSLVKDYSREELNAQAVELGVEKPEELASKPEVAQAIVDAKANQANGGATS